MKCREAGIGFGRGLSELEGKGEGRIGLEPRLDNRMKSHAFDSASGFKVKAWT